MTEPRLDKALREIIRLAHPDRGLPDGELAHRITARCSEYLQTMSIAGKVRSNRKEIPAKRLREIVLESNGSTKQGAKLARLSLETYRKRLVENGLYALARQVYTKNGTTRLKRGPTLELPYDLKLRPAVKQIIKESRLAKGIPKIIPPETIQAVLKRNNYRISAAADYLDISSVTLKRHMKKHGMYTEEMRQIQSSFSGNKPKGVTR